MNQEIIMESIDQDLKCMKSFDKLVNKYLNIFQSWEKEKQPTFLISIMKTVLKRNSDEYLLGYKKMYFDIYLAFFDKYKKEKEVEIKDTMIDTLLQEDIEDIMKIIKNYRYYNDFTKNGFIYDLQYDKFYDDKEEYELSSMLETKYDSLEKYYQPESQKIHHQNIMEYILTKKNIKNI